jgi:hypothetical protein
LLAEVTAKYMYTLSCSDASRSARRFFSISSDSSGTIASGAIVPVYESAGNPAIGPGAIDIAFY